MLKLFRFCCGMSLPERHWSCDHDFFASLLAEAELRYPHSRARLPFEQRPRRRIQQLFLLSRRLSRGGHLT
jgi:hypothetical protein